MPETREPIRVPWSNRFRFWLTRRLQAMLFLMCVAAVAYLWFQQSPRIVLKGQVEMVQVVVTASRDGTLELVEVSPDQFDRVERGVTSIARFDISDALLSMESLTAERKRLQAELEAERYRLRREALAMQWEVNRQRQQVEQFSMDRDRMQTSNRQRIDRLRSDLSDLEQSSRQWEIKKQENAAEIERLNLVVETLETSRPQLEKLVERRMAAATRLEELDRELKLQREMRRQAKQLAETLVGHGNDLQRQFTLAKQRLQTAESDSAESTSMASALTIDTSESSDPEVALAPFAEAIAVQDARIRVLAHQIATHEILAPASGQIAEVHQRPGTFLRRGDPIVTIATSEPRWIVAYLERSDQLKMAADASVEIRVDGNPSKVFTSKITDRGQHFSEVPTMLRDRSEIEQWGVPIKIPVPPSMDVMPGQTVELVIY